MLPLANALLPTDPSNIRSFGYQRTPTHRHNGIDLPAQRGTPVRAAAPGVVMHANDAWSQGFSGYGRVVVLEHEGGIYTLYAHLERVDVRPGQRVAEGAQLGTVGTSEFTNDNHGREGQMGSHLHFEVAAHPYPMASTAQRLDPIQWLRGVEYGELIAQATAQPRSEAAAGALLAFAAGLFLYAVRKR